MVIEAALDIVRPAAEAKSIGLETSYQAETDVITGDPERLQQVIWNLLSNAVKFTPEGGQVSVQVERVDPHLQVTVKDTGKGISRDFLPHVFDRFHQADSSSTRRHGGLGLGLALVRHLVELHGGTVSADSPGEGQGTSFIIHLPLRAVRATINEAEAPEANRNVGFHLPPALEGLRILLVDDEADARDLVALMLEQQGAEVEATSSAREALAVLTKGQQPDVIVSDIGMPDEDGYALIRQVRALPRAQGRPIPAVALTAYGRASDRIAALSAGFQMHVPKPVEPTELIMVIAGLTGRVGKGMNA
jgi:CheY-like chemotaxis protein